MKRYIVFGVNGGEYDNSGSFAPLCHSDSFIELREMSRLTSDGVRPAGILFGCNPRPYDIIRIIDIFSDKVYEISYSSPTLTAHNLHIDTPEEYNQINEEFDSDETVSI